MCKELDAELDEADRVARELAEHLERMGAANCKIPITLDSGCYIIEIRKTI